MRLAVVCRICGGDEYGCGCRKSFARYLQIFDAVDRRNVSTREVTSKPPLELKGRACIDKINFRLPSPMSESELKSRLKTSNLTSRLTRLRDRHWYLQVGDEELGWYFLIPHPNASITHTMITRPSAFQSQQEYREHLLRIFSVQELEALEVTRLDLAVDYPEEFMSVLNSLDVQHKRTKIQFMDEGSRRTGLNVGKGSEKLVVYDKGLKSGNTEPLTRLELQLSGAKLPAKTLNGIERSLTNDSTCTFFDKVSLYQIETRELSNVPSIGGRDRLQELQIMLKREGYLATRKKLDENGNFLRDYGPLMVITPKPEQPNMTFRVGMKRFFKTDKPVQASGLSLVTTAMPASPEI